MKSSNSIGCGKELCVTTTNWSMNGVPYTSYGYTFSEDRFERPIKTAYKVTLHGKSYRNDKGQVTKKQYHVTTIKYYDLIDFNWCDCVMKSKIEDIAEEMGTDYELIWEETAKKLDALQDKVNAEFEQTEEFKTKEKHDAVLKKIYFSNEDYFEKIKRESDRKKEYKEQSRSYQKNYQSNYNDYSGSYGTGTLKIGLYTDREKEYLNKFYKALAVKFHPDVLNGDNEPMQLVNKLKAEWGI